MTTTSANHAAAIATLRFFNEKADTLEQSRFFQSRLQEKSGFRVGVSEEHGLTHERFGPDQDAINAAVLTYRFFTISNEATSLGRMQLLFDSLPISPEIKARFDEARMAINTDLDSPTRGMTVVEDGQALTRREVIKTFMHGNLSHANKPATVARYNRWRAEQPRFVTLEALFVDSLSGTIVSLLNMREIIGAALEELGAD